MKVVFASHNTGKIRELTALLKDFNFNVIPQAELGVNDIEETGKTFVENALLKARHAAEQTGLPAIADDSGLVVPILNGEPGLFSARYAGEKSSAENNIKKLLHELRDVPDEKRQAYFYCVLTLLRTPLDPVPLICEGKWHGKILTTPRGEKGFGYDPVFFDEDQQSSAAELSLEIKNRISHRGKALRQLLGSLAHPE